MLSERIKNMIPSMTVGLTDKIQELKRKGIDVIGLNIGEPDFNTPENIIEAAKSALDEGFTKYTVVAGILELREAICEKLKKDNNLEYSPNEIIVSSGAKQSLTNALLTLCEPGEEVIVLTPCWVSYIEMVKLSGATPVLVSTDEDDGFSLNIDKIREAITSKTKAIMINTPNNPTGVVYSKEELKAIGELAVKHNFYIISDEIYEKLIYDNESHTSIASISQEIKDKTLVINGFSKSYAMTGWRLGYTAGPREIIKGMVDLQGHMTSAVNSIAQKAAVEAIKGPQDSVKYMLSEYEERRKYLLNRLRAIDNISCNDAKGAFYLMPKVSKFFGLSYKGKEIKNCVDFAEFLLEEAYVSVVPGIAFSAPGYVRISYATSIEKIQDAMDRIEVALKSLK